MQVVGGDMRSFVAEHLIEKLLGFLHHELRDSDELAIGVAATERSGHAGADLDLDVCDQLLGSPEPTPMLESQAIPCRRRGLR